MARNRPEDALRPIEIVLGFLERNPTGVLYSCGNTKVLCTASLVPGVPPFLEGKGQGWATAEYDLLPGATQPRHARDRNGRISGRTQEIQRMVGRCLRGVLDLKALDGFTLTVDCDVLQADGGTRSASVNGAWISSSLLAREAVEKGILPRFPIREGLGAVSAGIVGGRYLLDLDYEEDSAADVDLNLVLTESGKLIEIQATSAGGPFSLEDLEALTRLGRRGIEEILRLSRKALDGGARVSRP